MDFEKITGFTNDGTYCIWCNYHYPSSFFRQSLDVCGPCEQFRFKHNYDHGNFFVRDVNEFRFRVFLSSDVHLNDTQIENIIKNSF